MPKTKSLESAQVSEVTFSFLCNYSRNTGLIRECPDGFVRSDLAVESVWIGLHQQDPEDETSNFVWSDGS
eukprot:SAG31_NODE_14237_length_819_cov_1.051389_2_plen_69_part_01